METLSRSWPTTLYPGPSPYRMAVKGFLSVSLTMGARPKIELPGGAPAKDEYLELVHSDIGQCVFQGDHGKCLPNCLVHFHLLMQSLLGLFLQVIPGIFIYCCFCTYSPYVFFIYKVFIYLFLGGREDRGRERVSMRGGKGGGQKERDKQTPRLAGDLTWGSMPGPQEYDLSQNQTLK